MALHIREVRSGFTALIAAHLPLGARHYAEIVNDPLMPYAPDFERFQRLEDDGLLAALGVFDGEQLVGYSANLITTHLHHKSVVTAINDMIFIDKAHRRGRIGLELIEATKRLCQARGATVMLWFAVEGTPLAKLLPKRGCALHELIFSEPLLG